MTATAAAAAAAAAAAVATVTAVVAVGGFAAQTALTTVTPTPRRARDRSGASQLGGELLRMLEAQVAAGEQCNTAAAYVCVATGLASYQSGSLQLYSCSYYLPSRYLATEKWC